MGFWSTNLFGNDTTLDVRNITEGLLQTKTDYLICDYEEIFKEYLSSDESCLVWYSLAYTLQTYGFLNDEIKQKALECIKKEEGVELWERPCDKDAWLKELTKLKKRLNSHIKAKPITLYPQNTAPWKIGDIYAYELHLKTAGKSKGKYIFLQKINEANYFDDKKFSVVHVFDVISERIISAEQILKYRSLPFNDPEQFIAAKENNYENYTLGKYLDMDVVMLPMTKRAYPGKYLTYCGSSSVSCTCVLDNRTLFAIEWKELDECFEYYYQKWRDYEYACDGTGSIVWRTAL